MNDFLIALAFIWIIGTPILTIVLLIMVRNSRQILRESEARIELLEKDIEQLVSIVKKLQTTRETIAPPPPETKKEAPVAEPHTPPQPPPLPPKPKTTMRPPEEPSPDAAPIAPLIEESIEPSPSLLKSVPINWEKFMGVNLFAWIGGFVLFLAAAFFVKYSIDNNLISPQIRVAIGFLLGIGLLIAGFRLTTRDLKVTAQTLLSTGILILYADIFASHSFYQFIGTGTAFLLMVLVTATAFLLAVRLDARVIAILGLLGGFLTPPLLSTGEDNPFGLFSYIAVLNIGLIAIALKKRWSFLILLAAAGTAIMEIGWANRFFMVQKVQTAWIILTLFETMFLLAFVAARRLAEAADWHRAAALLMPFVALGFTFYLLTLRDLGARPGTIFSFVLVADLCLMIIVFVEPLVQIAYRIASLTVFSLLTIWTLAYLSEALLNWSLGLAFGFAVVHSVFPLILQRKHPESSAVWWIHLFPPMALVLILIPIFKFTEVSLAVWFIVFLIDLLALYLAILTSSVLSLIGVLLLTLVSMIAWLFRMPVVGFALSEILFLVAAFAVFFFAGGILAGQKLLKITQGEASGQQETEVSPQTLAQIPALSAILPFFLLILITLRLPLADPSPIFALGLLLVILMLALWYKLQIDSLTAVAMVCCLSLEYVWYESRFLVNNAGGFLAWCFLFFAVFAVLPFVFSKRLAGRVTPWVVAALSGPLHFYLFYKVILAAFPTPYMGILPAVFSIPALASLYQRIRSLQPEQKSRNAQLAVFGGAALFFITLIFPIQFEREWITIGWALEGAALIWLFRRVPHRGLLWLGSLLLIVAFLRLTMNPAVLSYYRRSTVRIWNWYLYTYGITVACLLIGARLSSERLAKINTRALLYSLGAILAFYLLNIEIADYFAQGATLTFQFSGNFARDMSYSIGWAVFAFGMLIIGIRRNVKGARYAAMGLLGITLLKLFFHDLGNLNQLYRVGALVVVAIVLILASYLYQRFVSFEPKQHEKK